MVNIICIHGFDNIHYRKQRGYTFLSLVYLPFFKVRGVDI